MTAPAVEAWSPACMDAGELAAWEATNERLSSANMRAARPCTDCLLGFALEMRAEGRCNGTPGGATEEEEDMDETPTRTLVTAGASLPVSLALPCGTCAHAPVCRIRPELEALTSVAVSMPRIDKGAHVSLSASVECDWYAKAKGAPKAVPGEPRKNRLTPEGLARMQEVGRQTAARIAAKRAAAQNGGPPS